MKIYHDLHRPSTLLLSTAGNTMCQTVLPSLLLVIVETVTCVSFDHPYVLSLYCL